MKLAVMELQNYRLNQGDPNRGDLAMFIKDILNDQLVAIPMTVVLFTYRARRFPGWEKVTKFQLEEAMNDLIHSRQVVCDRSGVVRRFRIRVSEEV
jgi:hypothetical protein